VHAGPVRDGPDGRVTAALKGLPEESRDHSLAFNEMGDHLARQEDIGEARIAAMDEQGIDMQIISVAPPATGPIAPVDAVVLSREMNDLAAEAVHRDPSRLRAMSTLPMADPSAVAGELERAAGLGFVGAMVYDDLFAAAAALGQPIFIHPQIPPRTIRQAAYAGFDPMTDLALSTFGWGWHSGSPRHTSDPRGCGRSPATPRRRSWTAIGPPASPHHAACSAKPLCSMRAPRTCAGSGRRSHRWWSARCRVGPQGIPTPGPGTCAGTAGR
jgi:hypothetical protein